MSLRFAIGIVVLVPALFKFLVQRLDYVFVWHCADVLDYRPDFCNECRVVRNFLIDLIESLWTINKAYS